MQGIKALVIFMGVLIVAGMVALVYGMVTQVGKMSDKDKARSDIVVPMAGVPAKEEGIAAFGRIEAPLPQGARVEETDIDGSTLTLRYSLPDGRQEILVFDLGAGRNLGTVTLTPGGGAQ